MLLEEDRQVGVGGGLVERVGAGDGAVEDVPGRYVRVVVADGGAEPHQSGRDLLGGCALLVGEVGLVGDSEEQDAGAAGGFAVLVEEGGGALDDVPGHACVDLLGEFHHAQTPAAVAGEVLRDGVAAEAGAGPEGLGSRTAWSPRSAARPTGRRPTRGRGRPFR
ncbi:hypothetical protein GCM10020256_29270 [Streptomyces thermocoprophilus]